MGVYHFLNVPKYSPICLRKHPTEQGHRGLLIGGGRRRPLLPRPTAPVLPQRHTAHRSPVSSSELRPPAYPLPPRLLRSLIKSTYLQAHTRTPHCRDLDRTLIPRSSDSFGTKMPNPLCCFSGAAAKERLLGGTRPCPSSASRKCVGTFSPRYSRTISARQLPFASQRLSAPIPTTSPPLRS